MAILESYATIYSTCSMSGILEYDYAITMERVLSSFRTGYYQWLQWWRVLPSPSNIDDKNCYPELSRHKRCSISEHLSAPYFEFYYGLTLLDKVELVAFFLDCASEVETMSSAACKAGEHQYLWQCQYSLGCWAVGFDFGAIQNHRYHAINSTIPSINLALWCLVLTVKGTHETGFSC